MEPSRALEDRINTYAEKLGRYDHRITSCNVIVAAPHHHRHQGYRYLVRLRICVPGEVVVVSQDHESNPRHEDPYIAARDAFRSARRQLQDSARIHRHMIKHHSPDPKHKFKAQLDESYADES